MLSPDARKSAKPSNGNSRRSSRCAASSPIAYASAGNPASALFERGLNTMFVNGLHLLGPCFAARGIK